MFLIKAIKNINESRREWMLNKFAFEAKRSGRTSNYKLWQDGFHPVILDTNLKIAQRLRYIHQNPINAGFVEHESHFVNSSYRAYEEDSNQKPNVSVTPLH